MYNVPNDVRGGKFDLLRKNSFSVSASIVAAEIIGRGRCPILINI